MLKFYHSGIHWLGQHLFDCPFKRNFGIDCPGCGLQRSFLALVNGDLIGSFKFYPATIPLLALSILTFLHLKLDFKFGAFVIKILVGFIAFIIVINYIYKIYHHQLSE
ncbi:hypothetical protein ABIB40_003445 [Pedobacter sp. UYP30]|uniref:DUF2752 domain-containing protein n=1 Tax=Pedobacter sp. UYP30 TaxID=1756400 RepID=UPI003394660F